MTSLFLVYHTDLVLAWQSWWLGGIPVLSRLSVGRWSKLVKDGCCHANMLTIFWWQWSLQGKPLEQWWGAVIIQMLFFFDGMPCWLLFPYTEIFFLTVNMQFNSRISSAVSLVQRLQTDCNGSFVRGAYLANIEIERRCRLRGTKHDDNFVEALLSYFYRFVFLFNWIWHLAILVTSSSYGYWILWRLC